MATASPCPTQLAVSRGVVVEAYAQLAAEGYLTARQGAGTRVARADFVASGALDHHLCRTRRRYRARRDALLAALERHLPELRVQGVAAGLHVVALLPEGTDEQALLAAAYERGIELHGLALNRFAPGPPGLILGYAAMPEPSIEAAVAELAPLVRSLAH